MEKSDKKLERLLNLVLALLGTEKFLTKSKITSAIPGYEGNAESRDRMFERDKDDLRKIGIEIEVQRIDPLFEDEVGYRIDRNSYGIEMPALTAEEGLIASSAISLASRFLKSETARTAWLKVGSLVGESESLLDNLFSDEEYRDPFQSTILNELTFALKSKRLLRFLYTRDLDGLTGERVVEPLRLHRTAQGWLLRGWDRERNDVRSFLVDNIDNLNVSEEFFSDRERPGQSQEDHGGTRILVRIKKNLIEFIRLESGRIVESDSNHLLCSFTSYNAEELLRILIGMDPMIEVVGPDSAIVMQNQIKARVRDAIR